MPTEWLGSVAATRRFPVSLMAPRWRSNFPVAREEITVMNEIDRVTEASDDYGHPETQPPSIYRLVRALAAYRVAIGTGLIVVTLGYLLVAALMVWRAPSQRVYT